MPQRELVVIAILSSLMMASLVVWLNVARRLSEGETLVPYEPRLRAPWNVVDVLWLVLAWPIFELVSLRAAAPADTIHDGGLSIAGLAGITAGHFLWAVAAIFYLEIRTGARAREFGFDTGSLAKDARLGGLAFLAAAPLVYGVQIVVSKFWTPLEHPLAKLVSEQNGPALVALAALSAIVVAPLSEELLFRVILQGWLERALRRRSRTWKAAHRVLPILISSALFSVMHQGADRVALFVLALFLGFLYRQTHRIFPSLVLHACINALAVLALALGVG
jgi:membrane protease YdiL (CAAX protease family)